MVTPCSTSASGSRRFLAWPSGRLTLNWKTLRWPWHPTSSPSLETISATAPWPWPRSDCHVRFLSLELPGIVLEEEFWRENNMQLTKVCGVSFGDFKKKKTLRKVGNVYFLHQLFFSDAEGKGNESQPERDRREDHQEPSRQRAHPEN